MAHYRGAKVFLGCAPVGLELMLEADPQ